jgi:TolA-binding protein
MVIRTAATIACLACVSCATDGANRQELTELTLSLRALRDENARLGGRIEKLERQLAVAPSMPRAARAGAPPSGAYSSRTSIDALPPLTVVKMKPRKNAVPKMRTDVAVVEPSFDQFDELASPTTPPASPEEDDTSNAVAETQFQRALDALRTGAVEEGVKKMLAFVSEWPKHARGDNSLYFAGVGQMKLGEFKQAEATLSRVQEAYPAGDAVVETLLLLGECRLKMNRIAEAKSTWEGIVAAYPGTPSAAQAANNLTSLSAATAARQ